MSNSTGFSGPFGQDNPYPIDGYWVTKPADVPASEATAFSGTWNETMGGAGWSQTLSPNSPPGEFVGLDIYEYASGTGSDTCYFNNSKFTPFTSINTPGYGWPVTSKNTWGTDWVGWTLSAVQYYRQQKRVPCVAKFSQQMVIDAAFDPNNPNGYAQYTDDHGAMFWGIPYGSLNALSGKITSTSVTSSRAGKTATNTTWK